MPKILDEECDLDVEFKTNNEYAKNYDIWRKKEEVNRLKTKYGDEVNLSDGESSSSDDDEDAVELTQEMEKDFFKTLSCLKSKDPRIYDKNVNFFNGIEESEKTKKKKKERPMYLKDYERKLILEKGGVVSDEEEANEDNRPRSPTYVEEQMKIKENLKNVLKNVEDENNEGEWGGLFKARQKTKEEKDKEEADYRQWLAGQTDNDQLEDNEIKSELKPLKEYWNKPDLDEGEKFLRDYILNKKFLDKDNEDYIPTYDEIIHDSDENEEETVEKQEEFEHKYNFRFEEPDDEFIKRYPRTIENSLRKTDDRRKLKRAEVKERKKVEKEQKMADLKKLQELKRKEIEEKIDKLKEITGNNEIPFEDEDIDGDFDPEAHDRRMQAIFNDNFYQGQEEDQKPEFPDIDEELEIENWDKFESTEGEDLQQLEPHCEDEDFNMDADYSQNVSTQEELIENSKGKKKRRRKSKFAQAVSKPKPKYDPTDKNYEEYFEEYYKLDCEDIIGDVPCRFKYRKVVPNDFGLTTEEILLAKDRELNKWCSLKKAIQIRPEHIEKYDKIAYSKKANNFDLKKKILPSLFVQDSEEIENSNNTTRVKIEPSINLQIKPEESNNNNKKKRETRDSTCDGENQNGKELKKGEDAPKSDIGTDNISNKSKETPVKTKKSKKKKKVVQNKNISESSATDVSNPNKRKRKVTDNSINKNNKKTRKDNSVTPAISDARLAAYGINPKKYKNKLKYGQKS